MYISVWILTNRLNSQEQKKNTIMCGVFLLCLFVCLFLKKGPAKPKKAKEVEKAKPEEKAPEAPAENGETKAEEDVSIFPGQC